MLQVDENIGGRQDQKNNGLRTKTLIVGLLMVVGCFAVGYFNATTTTTTTATTRASQELTTNNIPNADAPQCTDDGHCPCPSPLAGMCTPVLNYPDYNCCSKTFTFDPDCCTATPGYCIRCGRKDASTLSSASSASVLKVDGMVSNLQKLYPYVTITNKTPYDTFPTVYGQTKDLETYVTYGPFCSEDTVWGVIVSGDAWTASSRGACLVTNIHTTLTIADADFPDGASSLTCKNYHSSGTGYSQFSIIMDGEDACSVVRI